MPKGSCQMWMEEKVTKYWPEIETPSPTCRQKSLLISSPFSHHLAATSEIASFMEVQQGDGEVGCKLGNGWKVTAHGCFGWNLINILCERQKENKQEAMTVSVARSFSNYTTFHPLFFLYQLQFSCLAALTLPEGVSVPSWTLRPHSGEVQLSHGPNAM